jgi:hypothetical protein
MIPLRCFYTLKLPKKLDLSSGKFLVDFGFLCGFLWLFMSLSRYFRSFLGIPGKK